MEEKKVIVVDDTHEVAHEVANVASRGLTRAMNNSIIGGALAIQALGGGWFDEPRPRNFNYVPTCNTTKAKRRARKAQRQARKRNRR